MPRKKKSLSKRDMQEAVEDLVDQMRKQEIVDPDERERILAFTIIRNVLELGPKDARRLSRYMQSIRFDQMLPTVK